MDKITLKNIKIFAYHGVYPEETKNGQHFYIDVEMFLDCKKTEISDSLDDTVDYSKVYDIIVNITKNNTFKLIETLSFKISQEILSKNKKIKEVIVRVRKPEAPMDGFFDYVEFETRKIRE